jgi:hypothetical protein
VSVFLFFDFFGVSISGSEMGSTFSSSFDFDFLFFFLGSSSASDVLASSTAIAELLIN